MVAKKRTSGRKRRTGTKPRVGFFGMTSCKGCYFQFLTLNEKLLDVFRHIEISNFWMLNEVNKGGKYDIAFMDGAVSNRENVREVREVRKNSRFLVAFGTCACLGGIPGLRNDLKGCHQKVYGRRMKHMPLPRAEPIDKYVKVDYYMFGCPVSEDETLRVVRDLLLGKKPREPDHPVCVDCKKAGVRCLFKDGVLCDGCRGPLPDANWASEVGLMEEHGIDKKQIRFMFRKYAGLGKNHKEMDE
jgi:sulfhydrogenase subunit delta